MNKNIVLVGAGGHCRSVLDTLISSDIYDKIVAVGKQEEIGNKICGVNCVGTDEDLPLLLQDGFKDAFVVLGLDPNKRKNKIQELISIGFSIPNIIDASANISKHVILETGIFVGKNAIVNTGTKIKQGVIINTGVIIEHDCVIENFVSVAPGSVICGGCTINTGAQIGAGTIIKNNIKIGANSIIGVGSIVVKDIDGDVVAFGNLCKKTRNNIEEGVFNEKLFGNN